MENNPQNLNTFEQPSAGVINPVSPKLKILSKKLIKVVVVCFAVGLTFVIYSKSAKSDLCQDLDQQAQYSCYLEVIAKAKVKQDLSVCKSIKPQNYKNHCFGEVAISKKDISICNKINGPEGLDKCYSGVLDSLDTVGHFGATVSLCDSLKDGQAKDGCYYNAGVESRDVTVCDKIRNKKSDTFSNCYIYIGIALKDMSVCGKEMVKSSTCYRIFADSLNDISICEKIDSQKDRNFCYRDYAFKKNDPSSCDKITDTESRDFCYRSSNEQNLPFLNRGLPDFSVCAKIQSLSEKDLCYIDAIRAAKDFSCSRVNGKEKDYCLTVVADIKTDPSLCKSIIDRGEQGRCFGKIFSSYVYRIIREETGTCKDVADNYAKDSCYFHYARYRADYSVCPLIQGKYYLEECNNWAARKSSPNLNPEP